MQPELTQFEHWLSCQYPHSGTKKHYVSDLVLFFSYYAYSVESAEEAMGNIFKFTLPIAK
jgi:hypothetical protein